MRREQDEDRAYRGEYVSDKRQAELAQEHQEWVKNTLPEAEEAAKYASGRYDSEKRYINDARAKEEGYEVYLRSDVQTRDLNRVDDEDLNPNDYDVYYNKNFKFSDQLKEDLLRLKNTHGEGA